MEKAKYTCPKTESVKYSTHSQLRNLCWKKKLLYCVMIQREFKFYFHQEAYEFMWKSYRRKIRRSSLWLELVPEIRGRVVDYETIDKYCQWSIRKQLWGSTGFLYTEQIWLPSYWITVKTEGLVFVSTFC